LALLARHPAIDRGMTPMPVEPPCVGSRCTNPERDEPSKSFQMPSPPKETCPDGTVMTRVRPNGDYCVPDHPAGDQVRRLE